MSLIEVNIHNSFNRSSNKAQQYKGLKNDLDLDKGLNNTTGVNSINVTSLTSSAVDGQANFIKGDIKRKTLVREVLVGAAGSVLGSVTTYLLMNFLR